MNRGRKTGQPKVSNPFRIVGIGGSAGGLEAYEKFFSNIPEKSGLGYVLVSHLDPHHKSMLTELLQGCCTNMLIQEIKNSMRVKPNHVYIMPPNTDLSLLNGVLHLLPPSQPHGVRQPINLFFESLATDQEHLAVCVVLSGMGSDGTRGMKAIKEKGGMVMVQDPESAKFDSMPKSAINTGLADFILPPEEMPGKLIGYVRSSFAIKNEATSKGLITDADLDHVIIMLRRQTGHDFSGYKKNTIRRRIERRMSIHQIQQLSKYMLYLQKNVAEAELLFKELLIGVTHFFRDEEAFKVLKKKVISPWLKDKTREKLIRIWSVGCSTGEEAYSLSILFREELARHRLSDKIKVQIFATDIDEQAIEIARRGIFPNTIQANVSDLRLRKYFTRQGEAYRVRKEIRDSIVFAVHNVIKEPPFMRLDLLCCRNVLIYFLPELQKKIFLLFHNSLKPRGTLFLGTSESVGNQRDLFSNIDGRWKLFKNSEISYPINKRFELPFLNSTGMKRRKKIPATDLPKKPLMVSGAIHKILLEEYSAPSVIIDRKGDILRINGKTGKYLELLPGAAQLNIFSMIREAIAPELEKAVNEVILKKKQVTSKNIKITFENHYETIDLQVKPFPQKDGMKDLLLVVFLESGIKKLRLGKKALMAGKTKKEYERVQNELHRTREELRQTMETLETSVEEYNSSNEELQSSNEELQSMNEEAMTAKEEMQSLNEELLTVNTELHSKIEDLDQSANDMKNLLESTEIATIFLDQESNIKGFTPQATSITNLIVSDIGRPFKHIRSKFPHQVLEDLISQVMDKWVRKEVEVQTSENMWYFVRIMPYRTHDNVIDGVVITFNDITALKNLEKELRTNIAFAENVINTVREPLIVLNSILTVVAANNAFYEMFKVIPSQTIGQVIFDLGNKQWKIPELKKLLHEIISKDKVFNDFIVTHQFPEIGKKIFALNARRIKTLPETDQILIAMEDITNVDKQAAQNHS